MVGKLTNRKTLEYRIIGISHDDLVDGSSKAGLTFEATNSALGSQRMNATDTNAGGWEKSELRTRLNIGDLWSLLPTELQSKVKPVTKTTDNVGGNWGGAPSTTADKVFCSWQPKYTGLCNPTASSTSAINPRA